MMKICVVGAGSIGGYMAVKLAAAGEDVTVIARGAHLQAIRAGGLRLIEAHNSQTVRLTATDRLDQAGQHDLVILAVKGHQIAPIAEQLGDALKPEGVLLPVQNGIPWWYFQRHGGEYQDHVLESVDPGGKLARSIDASRLLGCISYPAAEIAEPGVIRHIEGTRFPVGELDGSNSARAQQISEALKGAGFKSPILDNIRAEIWLKLWGNLTFNPISALTHSTLVDICQFPLSRNLAAQMMTEAQTVAHKLGITFRVSLEKRIAGAEGVGKHKTSMLQDVEYGKALEIDSLLGVVIELGQLTQTPTPHLDSLYACVKLLDKTIHDEAVRIKAESLN